MFEQAKRDLGVTCNEHNGKAEGAIQKGLSSCLVGPSIEGLLETRGDAQGSNSQAARQAQEPAKARSSRSSSEER